MARFLENPRKCCAHFVSIIITIFVGHCAPLILVNRSNLGLNFILYFSFIYTVAFGLIFYVCILKQFALIRNGVETVFCVKSEPSRPSSHTRRAPQGSFNTNPSGRVLSMHPNSPVGRLPAQSLGSVPGHTYDQQRQNDLYQESAQFTINTGPRNANSTAEANGRNIPVLSDSGGMYHSKEHILQDNLGRQSYHPLTKGQCKNQQSTLL